MGLLKQIIGVTALNLRTVPRRLGSSGVAIVGIAGVVVVLVAVLSIAEGFSAAMRGSNISERARPFAFARYIARSAAWSSASRSC